MASDIELALPALAPSAAPDLHFTLGTTPPGTAGVPATRPLGGSADAAGSGEGRSAYGRGDTFDLVRFTGLADFYLFDELIHCHAEPEADRVLLELRLLGPVASLWLERRGRLALHGAAISLHGKAVGLLGSRGAGKSSLAAALVAAGCPLLSDDLVAVAAAENGLEVLPSFPRVRMWSDLSRYLFGSKVIGWRLHASVEKWCVPIGEGFGSFSPRPTPLALLLLPQRTPTGGLELEPLKPREAVIEILKHSFSPRLVEAAGLSPRRLELLIRLARQVPTLRLRYPSGYEHLGEVAPELMRALEPLAGLDRDHQAMVYSPSS